MQDEIYEFIKRILINPPGPRVPTTITSFVHTKQGRNSINNNVGGSCAEGNAKNGSAQRKRKNDGLNSDQETPAKTKYVNSSMSQYFIKSNFYYIVILIKFNKY